MTAECYFGACKHHSNHAGDEGPFCHEPKCLATPEEIETFSAQREAELDKAARRARFDALIAPCCANERRSMNGGCLNCGDPCL